MVINEEIKEDQAEYKHRQQQQSYRFEWRLDKPKMSTDMENTRVLETVLPAWTVVQLIHGYGYATGKHGSPVNLPSWLRKALIIPPIPTTADVEIKQQNHVIISSGIWRRCRLLIP
jgi:hypothetical protein